MIVTCPICNGTGEVVRSNGADSKKNKPHTCWLCNGEGVAIQEQAKHKTHIKKYLSCDGDYADV